MAAAWSCGLTGSPLTERSHALYPQKPIVYQLNSNMSFQSVLQQHITFSLSELCLFVQTHHMISARPSLSVSDSLSPWIYICMYVNDLEPFQWVENDVINLFLLITRVSLTKFSKDQ